MYVYTYVSIMFVCMIVCMYVSEGCMHVCACVFLVLFVLLLKVGINRWVDYAPIINNSTGMFDQIIPLNKKESTEVDFCD